MLDYLVEKRGKTKADILRDMIRADYNLTRFRSAFENVPEDFDEFDGTDDEM